MNCLSYSIRCFLLLSFCTLCICCKPSEEDLLKDLSTDQIAIVQALNKAIAPIQDADPERDFSELAPLDTALANAQVVGMGEGTHGTREFFQMKDRLFRYLVQKHGFQAIAFEANFGRSVIVNRYIHGQTTNLSTAAQAAKSMYFWTWSTDEVRELLQWMKDYNTGKPASQQLSFYGFDCQYADDEFPLIREFFYKVEPGLVSKVDTTANLYTLTTKSTATDSVRAQYTQRLPGLYNLFITNESQWVSAGGRTDYEIARQAARVLIQQANIIAGDACNATIKRDMYMAENVQWLLTRMNTGKLSLWAHNYHISTLTYGNCSQPSMGGYLKQKLKDKYLTVCTLLTNGTFTVRDASKSDTPLTQLSVHTADVKTSYNYLLGKAQYPNFIFKVNQSGLAPSLTSWLGANHPLFETGSGFNESRAEQYYSIAALTGRFDILIHFRDTSQSQLLP